MKLQGDATAFNEFSLETLKRSFGLRTEELGDYFAQVAPVPISDLLRQILEENVPLALENNTEKARSELIISPVLLEVRRRFPRRISLFSGVEFNVDERKGLRGTCDFLLSLSSEQLAVEAPVIAVVEAKNENIKQGVNQCIAEMVAAQQFNRERENTIEAVYGVVTTGSNWKFLRLLNTVVYIDRAEYYIKKIEKIIGILTAMVQEAFMNEGTNGEKESQ